MLHLTFRILRDRTIGRISQAHPGTRMVVWCNLQTDLVEVQGRDPAQVEALAQALARDHGARTLAPGQGERRTLALACEQPPRRSLSLLVEQHGGIVLPPLVVEDGWETFRVALFDHERGPAFLRELRTLGPFEVQRKRILEAPLIQEEFMIGTAELLGGLTRKQAEAFLAALQGGYYEVPRSATMVEIARRRGLPRATMEEHVRKAEAKLLTALGPFVALRVHTPLPPEERHAPPRPRAARRRAPPRASVGKR